MVKFGTLSQIESEMQMHISAPRFDMIAISSSGCAAPSTTWGRVGRKKITAGVENLLSLFLLNFTFFHFYFLHSSFSLLQWGASRILESWSVFRPAVWRDGGARRLGLWRRWWWFVLRGWVCGAWRFCWGQWSWGRLVLDKLTEIRNKVDASFSGIDRINEGQGLLFLCRFELPIAPFEDNLV